MSCVAWVGNYMVHEACAAALRCFGLHVSLQLLSGDHEEKKGVGQKHNRAGVSA